MRNLLRVFSILLVVLLVAMPVMAQDALPVELEESPVGVLSIAVVVLGAACIILMGMVVMLLNKLGANVEMVRDMVPLEFLREINQSIDERMTTLTKASQTPIDDMIWGVAQPLLQKAVDTIVGDAPTSEGERPIPPAV